jgi:hypothetical protein
LAIIEVGNISRLKIILELFYGSYVLHSMNEV